MSSSFLSSALICLSKYKYWTIFYLRFIKMTSIATAKSHLSIYFANKQTKKGNNNNVKVCLGFKGNKTCRKKKKKKRMDKMEELSYSLWWDRLVSKVSTVSFEKIQIYRPCWTCARNDFQTLQGINSPFPPPRRTQTEICSSKVTGPHEEEGKYLMFVPSSLDGRWQVRAVWTHICNKQRRKRNPEVPAVTGCWWTRGRSDLWTFDTELRREHLVASELLIRQKVTLRKRYCDLSQSDTLFREPFTQKSKMYNRVNVHI